MYLSLLRIDVQKVRGRTWLANPYRVHQRLVMAFPDGEVGRLLFRIEADREPPRVLVQTAEQPEWPRAFGDHPILVAPPVQKEIRLAVRGGQRLRFFLRANPTARRSTERDADGKRQEGMRVGLLKEADQRTWLERKGATGGFRPLDYSIRSGGQIVFPRGGSGAQRQTHASADFEGMLEVTEPELFGTTVLTGIGAGKAFGFGLLSIAPA